MIPSDPPGGFIPKLTRAFGWCAFALLVLLCILSKGSTRVFTWPWAFYSQLLLLAPVLMVGWNLVTRRKHAGVGGLALASGALAIAVSVVSSNNPHFSFEAALYLWSGLAFACWTAISFTDASADENRVRTWARVAGLGLAAPVFSSIWQWGEMVGPSLVRAPSFREAFETFGAIRNHTPFGHPNYTGGYALLALPWFVSLIRIERGFWRMLWGLAVAGGVLLIFSSGSRGALLGSTALVGAALVMVLLTKQLSRRMGVVLFLVGTVAVAIAGFGNSRVRSLLTEPSGLRYPNVGDIQRLGMLEGGWLLAKQRPLVGHGPGMVPFVFPLVRAEVVGGVETSYQLHNAYLHQFVVTGAIGAVAALGLLLALARATLCWLHEASRRSREVALNSATALLAYGVMAATDYQLDVIGIVAALGLNAGVLLAAPQMEGVEGRNNEGRGAKQNSRSLLKRFLNLPVSVLSALPTQLSAVRATRLGGFLIIGCALAAAVLLIPHWRARYLHWSAWATIPDTNRPALLARLNEAARSAPWNVHYQNQIGLQRAQDAQQTDDLELRRTAREALQVSLVMDPAQEPVEANLGWLWLRDDPVEAERHFRRALTLIPDRDTVHVGLALSHMALGDSKGVVEALALECLVNPAFVASAFWSQPEFQPFHKASMSRLAGLIASAETNPNLPTWRRRDLVYFGAVLRWWRRGAAPAQAELAGADERQRRFFRAIGDDSAVSELPEPWAGLVRTRLAGTPDREIRTGGIVSLGEAAVGPRLLELLRTELATSNASKGIAFERAHYPMMHRNLDGPGYLDLAPRLIEVFRQRYVESLMPSKGLIPGEVMRDLSTAK